MKNKEKEIKRGDKILVDKGILGRIKGTFISVRGASAFGFWGLYKDEEGIKHIWDETVHRLIKV